MFFDEAGLPLSETSFHYLQRREQALSRLLCADTAYLIADGRGKLATVNESHGREVASLYSIDEKRIMGRLYQASYYLKYNDLKGISPAIAASIDKDQDALLFARLKDGKFELTNDGLALRGLLAEKIIRIRQVGNELSPADFHVMGQPLGPYVLQVHAVPFNYTPLGRDSPFITHQYHSKDMADAYALMRGLDSIYFDRDAQKHLGRAGYIAAVSIFKDHGSAPLVLRATSKVNNSNLGYSRIYIQTKDFPEEDRAKVLHIEKAMGGPSLNITLLENLKFYKELINAATAKDSRVLRNLGPGNKKSNGI